MFSGVINATTEARDIFRLILDALANPTKAQALIKDLTAQMDQLDKVRDEAVAAQREAERTMLRAKDEHDAVARVKAEIEQLQAEAQLRLDQGSLQLAEREKNLAAREAALVANTQEVNENLKAQRIQLNSERQALEDRVAQLKRNEESFAKRTDEIERLRSQREGEIVRLQAKAARDAEVAADLKEKLEAKLSKINALAKSMGDE